MLCAAVATIDKQGHPVLLASGAAGVRRSGWAGDKKPPLQLQASDLMRLASCSKSFTSTLVGLLVEAGKLRFNDTLAKVMLGSKSKAALVPQILAAYQNVTVMQLLRHEAGLPRDGCPGTGCPWSPPYKYLENSTMMASVQRRNIAAWGLMQPPVMTVGGVGWGAATNDIVRWGGVGWDAAAGDVGSTMVLINNNNNNRRLVTLAEHTSDHGKQANSSTKEKGSHWPTFITVLL